MRAWFTEIILAKTVCVCVCVCVRACVRACVRVCVCVKQPLSSKIISYLLLYRSLYVVNTSRKMSTSLRRVGVAHLYRLFQKTLI